MKRLIIVFIICIVITFAYANEPQSMRNVATSGVFDGAWEKMYDPIDLKEIDGYLFFTNFADFSIQYNDMYGDISGDSETKFFEEFPIGLAFTNPFMKNLKHSLFVRFRHNQTPSYIGNDNSGEYEEYVTTYEDITGDDVYDIKTISYSKENDNDENNQLLDFIWNNNIQLTSFNLGLKFSSFSSREELDNLQYYNDMGIYDFGNYGYLFGFNWGDHSEEVYEEFYWLEEDDYYFKYTEKGVFSTIMQDNKNALMVSMEMNNGLRFDLGFENHNDLDIETHDKYNASYEEIVLADTLVNSGFINQDFKRKIQLDQNDINISALYKKELDSSFDGEKGFWEGCIDFGFISGEREHTWEHHLVSEEKIDSLSSTEYTFIESTDDLYTGEEIGDISGFHLGSHLLMNLPLNDYSNFGFGGYYTFSNIANNSEYTYEILNIESYQIGTSIDTENEYVQTETQYLSADKQSIVSNSEVKIPIALEFKMPDNHISTNDGFGLRNFTFRLGSTFLYNLRKTENTYDDVEKNPNLIITEYGDGTISESHDPTNELNSNKEIISVIRSSKLFSTGIGYKHSDNMSIDLGAYYNYDTEDYLVGVSFTVSK